MERCSLAPTKRHDSPVETVLKLEHGTPGPFSKCNGASASPEQQVIATYGLFLRLEFMSEQQYKVFPLRLQVFASKASYCLGFHCCMYISGWIHVTNLQAMMTILSLRTFSILSVVCINLHKTSMLIFRKYHLWNLQIRKL